VPIIPYLQPPASNTCIVSTVVRCERSNVTCTFIKYHLDTYIYSVYVIQCQIHFLFFSLSFSKNKLHVIEILEWKYTCNHILRYSSSYWESSCKNQFVVKTSLHYTRCTDIISPNLEDVNTFRGRQVNLWTSTATNYFTYMCQSTARYFHSKTTHDSYV